MNPALRLIDRAASTFNELPFWTGSCRVWDQDMASCTFERWLYLRAHRIGLMGRDDRRFLERFVRPGMRVLDIGSNLGLYSVLLGRKVGPTGSVVCFEPDPVLFAAFQKNCRANGVPWVTGHNVALGAKPARLKLHKMVINSGDNHLGETDGALFRRAIEIDVVALDSFLPDLRVDFIKIDIQGWELEAFRGMVQVLRAQPAVTIYFEFFPGVYRRCGSTFHELVDFLHEAGFRICNPETGMAQSRSDLIRLGESMRGMKYTNLLATR
jgi:FkbM family methyltransferase